MAAEKPKTVPAVVAADSLAFFGPVGTARTLLKGEAVDWPADDFDRAAGNGLVRPAKGKPDKAE